MIKPNWKIFKAKFSENPQSNFEWLCYVLFCIEFKKNTGIFRYKNQSGIETNPISTGVEVIGWQAKFYETGLANHKSELISTLNKSKRDYPNINKIIFYTNEEWGQRHIPDKPEQNDSQTKIDVETIASQLEIRVEWRTASFFESPFVTLENERIVKHFFSLEKSIIQLLWEKKSHTEAILESIQTSINYQNKVLEINRSNLLQDILDKLEREQVLIVTGMGGVGKTAVIKKLYEEIKQNTPFYIFKANEFETNNISNLFDGYNFNDFIDAHKEDEKKLIVIDSAEKILDLEKTDSFKEFISILLKHEWKIIFTARSNYLSDLDMQFIDHYKVKPFKFYVEALSLKALTDYAQEYDFNLPSDEKLLEVLQNPFYLNEYLRFYDNEEVVDYQTFKEKLWNKLIKKSKPNREQCFMKIAFQRANEGQFFISNNHDETAVSSLVHDGILGYEVAGYFITHDIYEEWALEKTIESEYIRRVNLHGFFNKIGESLPIRRSFRKWLSDKLLIEDCSIENLIEEVFESKDIPYFWKDEVLVSVLLSPYSDYFIDLFERELLENDKTWLKRMTFLLRVACKEVDEDYLTLIGLDTYSISAMKYIVTKPKGQGWKSVIKLIYKYKDFFEIEAVSYVLPVIYEWNKKFRNGETTRLAALIGLKYYKVIIEKDNYNYRENDTEEKIIQTILYGAREINDELLSIFSEVINNNWRKKQDPYYSLVNTVLSKLGDNQEVLRKLPNYVLQLAELYWIKPNEVSSSFNDHFDFSNEFSIEGGTNDYYPSSAYQTPIYWLLEYSFEETVNFILRFVNKTVESYVDSDLAEEVEEIKVTLNNKVIKQYISGRLWNAFRGTQGLPEIFQSVHMALEKFLLERAEHTDSEILENILLYLIENSKSSSITAIVTSVVLANHEKTFNIAKVLFKTKEFFFYDSSRSILEQTAKNLSMMGYGLNHKHDIHKKERIDSCDGRHREYTLETIARMYQFFKNEDVTNEESTKRMEKLWAIFDQYYKELQNTSLADNKTWRLFLARMDRREMTPTVKKVNQGVQIDFNPKIDSGLMEYSESALQKSYEATKYLPLRLWSDYKFKKDVKSSEYTKYEENPLIALKEIREMSEELENGYNEGYIFAKGTPAYVCAVLLRDYFSLLSQSDKDFCKEVALIFASSSLKPNYAYQAGDGVEAAISSLPVLLKYFPEEKESIKFILLFTLFSNQTIGISADFSDYSTKTILNELWTLNFEDAQSLLLGYLYLKPKYEDMKERLRLENFKNYRSMDVEEDFPERFLQKYNTDIQKVIRNTITLEEIGDINDIHPRILKTAFQLIPLETNNEIHNYLIQNIITVFAKKLLLDNGRDRIDYEVSNDFIIKLAEITLSSSSDDIPVYLNPFISNFNNSESISDLFKEFIYVENRLKSYDNFWLVWNLFFDKVVELNNKQKNSYGNSRIIKSYLFADVSWNENEIDWHTLNDQNKRFLKRVTRELGDSPVVLYSIAKLLNGIGKKFVNNGIYWISDMLSEHRSLWNVELEDYTIYYLENVTKNYIHINREKIKREARLKRTVLKLLDFLVEKGSVAGYMLRESIL